MKKDIALFLCTIFIIACAGCANNRVKNQQSDPSEIETSITQNDSITDKSENETVTEDVVEQPTESTVEENENIDIEESIVEITPTEEETENDYSVDINTEETEPPTITSPEAQFTVVSEKMYATTTVNVRTGPGTEYEKIGTLSPGEQVLRIAIGQMGWSKIIYNDLEAYVSSNYLSTRQIDYINPYDFNRIYSYGGYTSVDIEVIDSILREYRRYLNGDVDTVSIYFDKALSYECYQHVTSFFSIYFSDFDILDTAIDFIISGNVSTTIELNLDMFNEQYNNRAQLISTIESVLSTLEYGSEKYMVDQIANYICNNVSYDINYSNADDALFDGRGSCNAYSLLFQAMTSRLGIRCDLCVGYAGGSKHAWNKVTLSDGSVYYYDLSTYDNNGSNSYFAATSSPWTITTLNNYY